MSEYYTNGVQVYDLDRCLTAIKQRNYDNEYKISLLRAEVEKLRSEHFRDEKLQEMGQKLVKMEADCRRGFPITEEEQNKIDKWIENHDIEKHGLTTEAMKMKAGGAIGGRYSYKFTPTSIGVIGTVRCSCGDEYKFSEI